MRTIKSERMPFSLFDDLEHLFVDHSRLLPRLNTLHGSPFARFYRSSQSTGHNRGTVKDRFLLWIAVKTSAK